MFWPNFERDLVEEELCEKFIIVWCMCMCVHVYVSVCMCCVCMTCTYSTVDMHLCIHMLMYVEVSIIMVCNQHVPDQNKHEQTPDVLGERPWRLLGSRDHIIGRRERHRHSHVRTHADTRTHTRTHADTWHVRTYTYTRTRMHTRADTRTHISTHTHVHTHAHTPKKIALTHKHARRHTRDTHAPKHAHAHTHADTHMTRAGGCIPPRVHQPGKRGDGGGWAEERERRGMGYTESISAHTVITTIGKFVVVDRHDDQCKCMRNQSAMCMVHACMWTSRFLDVICVACCVCAIMHNEESRARTRT